MVNVIIEPYEPLVMDAIRLIEAKQPHYFNNVNKIILEQGDPGHFGKVQSDQEDTIYISVQKIRNALTGAAPEELAEKVAEVLAHEMGHLKSKFQGGEAPAEQEEEAMRNLLTAEMKKEMRAARYARSIGKTAIRSNSTPDELADSILRIIYHFAQKVNPEGQREYLQHVSERLRGIAAGEIAARQRNPGGGIGSSVSLIKNILAGLPAETVGHTLALVQDRVTKL